MLSRRSVRAGAVALGLLLGCAKIEAPPGAPPDAAAPRLLGTSPDSLAVMPGFSGEVTFTFDEVISEGSVPSQGTGTSDLERLVILSPTTRPPVVRWHRDRITVRPREGWVANRVYRVQLLPGVSDLRNNRQQGGGAIVTFTTGAPRPTLTLEGAAQDWVAGRAAAGALIEAVHAPDSLVYRALADSSGDFQLGPLPAGAYTVFATIDQNHNMVRDPREAFDSAHVAAGATSAGTLWAFPHDTVGPRIQTIAVLDSASASVTVSQPLDPAQRLTPADVSVRLLPDSSPVAVRSLLPPEADDSAFGRRADTTGRADTARRADTTSRADSSRRRQPPAAKPADTPARARADSTRRPARPVLATRLTLRIVGRWTPGARYVVTIRGLRNVNGVAADATAGVAVPAAPKPVAPPDSTGAATSPPDSTGVRPAARDTTPARPAPR